jgi:hypothetical protein
VLTRNSLEREPVLLFVINRSILSLVLRPELPVN